MRALAAIVLLVTVAPLMGSVAGPAHAEPGDAGGQTQVVDVANDGRVTLPWATLGLQPTLEFYGGGSTSVTLPVPAGLTVARLQGLIHAPINIDAGYLEIDGGDGKFLASVDLPPAGAPQAVTPFDVDISAALAQASSVDLTLTVRARNTGELNCGPVQRLTLSDLATVFAGTQLPVTTVASFFPPVLGKVTIYAATDASPAEQQAVLTLVSTLARLYVPRPLPIAVVSQPRGTPPPPASGLDRAVVVETGPAGLSVENAGMPDAYLRISGEGDRLSDQVSLLVTQLQPLAQTATARVDQAGSDAAPLSGDTLTFSQLKASGEASFFRTSSVDVGFDRASLGPRFDSVQVHLLADYTPVRPGDAATVVIRSGKLIVYRAALDGTGLVDATFHLDREMLDEQWINLKVDLTYTPNQTCGPLLAPIAFQINPRSTVTMHRGGPPLGGFAAFPSEFSPKFVVALDGSGPNQLSYAARVVAAVSRLTRTELTPQVVSLEAAVEATSGALIVAKADAISRTSLKPPISGDGSTVDFALPKALQVNIDQGLGSIQAFADPPRNRSVVLVTTSSVWTLVDPLFDSIDGPTRSWSKLTGDVLAAGAAGTPKNVTIRQTASNIFEPPRSDTSGSLQKTYIVGGVLVAVALLAITALLIWRTTRQSRRPVGAHSADDSTDDSY
ncbi:hypothetical protein [Mycolicibacterium pallens]|nr:hypothetical protein [Mycolicibacterium pallens]APE19277.1 hypothetical protein BOH72_18770 [Mycobacterium sp. WY10]